MARSGTHNELKNESLWTALCEPRSYAPLREDAAVDVCVIGAGIAGLSVAYRLAQEGNKVLVLDDGKVGGGMTSRTTAHLVTAVDDRYFLLAKLHSREVARAVASAQTWALDRIEATVQQESIECDFERVDGYLTLAPGDEPRTLGRERDAACDAGLHVELIERVVFPACGPQLSLCFPRQAHLHPLRYVAGLADAVIRRGGRICGDSHVDDVTGAGPVEVRVGSHRVHAGAVVVATNSPFTEQIAIHTKQAPYMTYVIAARVPRGSAPRALTWDTADIYHYVRLHSPPGASYDFLLVGGEDHRTGHADDADERFARLEDWMRERYLTVGEVSYAWAGQIMESADRLAFIGPSPSGDAGLFIVTGESGTGMTYATLAGDIIADRIAGRENPWASLYDPARRTYSAVSTFVKENLKSSGRLLDWLLPGEVSSTDAIPPDAGALLRRGLKKVAVYRDEHGDLHALAATCMHAGCIVRWNSIERTWDCPCHGSRYDRFGHVINGPAVRDLRPVEAA